MNWVEVLNRAIEYVEANLLSEITLVDVADHVHTSGAHLQRGFSALASITLGEYIRNRRLTLAAFDLTHSDAKVIDVALMYGYETPESFSKAFSRFHGVAPSAARQRSTELKSFSRLTIKVIMEGGSVMDYRIEEREAFEVAVKVKVIQTEDGDSTQIPAFWDEYFASGLPDPVLGICGSVSEQVKAFPYGIGDFLTAGQHAPEGFDV